MWKHKTGHTNGWAVVPAALLVFSLVQGVQAGEVELAWEPPTAEYGGFILSYGTESQTYQYNEDVGGNTTHTVTNLDPGQTYYFAVKAYDPSRDTESPYSNEVSATVSDSDTIPPSPPQGVRILIH